MNKYIKKISTLLVVFTMVTSAFYTPLVHKNAVMQVEANHSRLSLQIISLVELASTAVSTAASATYNLITSEAVFSLRVKELILDGIAFELATLTLKQMTTSIMQWVSVGLEGNPVFVTNLERFLLDTSDQESDKFIQGSELDFLCSTFELDVRTALAIQHQTERDFVPQIQCTFDDIGDLGKFLAGDFGEGGWAGWFEITQNIQNTPYGAFIKSKEELDTRIADRKERELTQLDWGDGTFSKTLCELAGSTGYTRENCLISMPGKWISETVIFSLETPIRRLIEADEINEIIGALFAQLSQQAVTGINGILGLSQGESGGRSGSYLESMLFEDTGARGSGLTLFENALLTEQDYKSLFVGVKATVDSVESENDANAILYPSCYRLSLPRDLRNFRSDAITGTQEADIAIAKLESMIQELEAGVTLEREQEIFNLFLSMRASGEIHTEVDIALAETELRRFDTAISDFEDDMNRQVNQCQQQDGFNPDDEPDHE